MNVAARCDAVCDSLVDVSKVQCNEVCDLA